MPIDRKDLMEELNKDEKKAEDEKKDELVSLAENVIEQVMSAGFGIFAFIEILIAVATAMFKDEKEKGNSYEK